MQLSHYHHSAFCLLTWMNHFTSYDNVEQHFVFPFMELLISSFKVFGYEIEIIRQECDGKHV